MANPGQPWLCTAALVSHVLATVTAARKQLSRPRTCHIGTREGKVSEVLQGERHLQKGYIHCVEPTNANQSVHVNWKVGGKRVGGR